MIQQKTYQSRGHSQPRKKIREYLRPRIYDQRAPVKQQDRGQTNEKGYEIFTP